MDKCPNCGANRFEVTEREFRPASYRNGTLEVVTRKVDIVTDERMTCLGCLTEYLVPTNRYYV